MRFLLGIRRCMKENAFCICVVSADMIHISVLSVFCESTEERIFSKQADHVSTFSNFTGSDSACWCMKCSSAMPLLDLPRICCQFLWRAFSWIIRPTSSSDLFLKCYGALKLVIFQNQVPVSHEEDTHVGKRSGPKSLQVHVSRWRASARAARGVFIHSSQVVPNLCPTSIRFAQEYQLPSSYAWGGLMIVV